MLNIERTEQDSALFLQMVEKVVAVKLEVWNPKDLFVVRIDNWFDEKWLKFSGTELHELAFWKLEDVTVPPFHPNRVVKEEFFRRENETWTRQASFPPLHIFQWSTDNFKRLIFDFSSDGIFVWYSANSGINKMGSMMVYHVREGNCQPFYFSCGVEDSIRLKKVKGIRASELNEIFSGNP